MGARLFMPVVLAQIRPREREGRKMERGREKREEREGERREKREERGREEREERESARLREGVSLALPLQNTPSERRFDTILSANSFSKNCCRDSLCTSRRYSGVSILPSLSAQSS